MYYFGRTVKIKLQKKKEFLILPANSAFEKISSGKYRICGHIANGGKSMGLRKLSKKWWGIFICSG